jgi:hypothetical protein
VKAAMLMLGLIHNSGQNILAAINQTSLTPSQEEEVTAAWQKAKKDCEDLCASPLTFDRLGEIRQQMLLDVTPPTGQYALLDDNGIPKQNTILIFSGKIHILWIYFTPYKKSSTHPFLLQR